MWVYKSFFFFKCFLVIFSGFVVAVVVSYFCFPGCFLFVPEKIKLIVEINIYIKGALFLWPFSDYMYIDLLQTKFSILRYSDIVKF